jgi:toxin ParE1/3/4
MAPRVIHLRALATADIDDAVDHYLGEGGGQLAHRFVDALEHAMGQIQRSPLSGSQRFSFELGIPELRARTLARFPFVIFYVVHSEAIDVWRVLHSRRDVLGAFRDVE